MYREWALYSLCWVQVRVSVRALDKVLEKVLVHDKVWVEVFVYKDVDYNMNS
jgi:hypothetical protein